MSKKYGLIKKDAAAARPPAFDSDSNSDEATESKNIGSHGPGANQKRLAKIAQEKALAEDPTVFQYDELYDDMESKRKDDKSSKSKQEKKPKYITKLLETADKRKKENERRIERQVQKEREAEGEQFKDKEEFVTSAYRAKLEDMRKADEEEKREEMLETMARSKTTNLDGFYRHIYEQKTSEKTKDSEEGKVKKAEVKDKQSSEDNSSAADEKKSSRKESSSKNRKKADKKSRSYRKRRSNDNKSNDENDDDTEPPAKKDKNKAHLHSNLDADSDFEIDSSDSEKDEPAAPAKSSSKRDEPKLETNGSSVVGPKAIKNGSKNNVDHNESSDEEVAKVKVAAPKKETIKKPKVDVWKKHTVGQTFEDALQRYYARKAAREVDSISA